MSDAEGYGHADYAENDRTCVQYQSAGSRAYLALLGRQLHGDDRTVRLLWRASGRSHLHLSEG